MFPEIGENLYQSVDNNAKVTKNTKDAKELTQRRRETQRRKEKILCSLQFSVSSVVFLLNRCKSVSIGG